MTGTGAMGLPFSVVGEVVQSLAASVVDRGHNREEVLVKLLDWVSMGGEDSWWSGSLGVLVDDLIYYLKLEDAE